MSILDDFKLDGKVAIVTGAGRGIGQATAVAFAEGGAKVVVADLDADPANETLELVKKAGSDGVVVTGNVASKDDCANMVKTAVDKLGGLDVMCNIAGITRDAMLHKMDEDAWNFVIDINLKGTFFCSQAAVAAMRELAKAEGDKKNSRKIINTASIAGLQGNKGQANYSAAKAGIVGMTKSIAKEGLMFNIQANVVAPGWVDTRLTAEKQQGQTIGIPGQDRQQTLMFMQVMGIRTGKPIDLARVFYFLACPASDYLTAQCLNVSGGLLT